MTLPVWKRGIGLAVPVMMRFDDDLATGLRERAQLERRSVNRLVNDVVRAYLEALNRPAAVTSEGTRTARASVLRKRFKEHVQVALSATKRIAHQETQADLNEKTRLAIEALTDCLQVAALAIDAEDEKADETVFA